LPLGLKFAPGVKVKNGSQVCGFSFQQNEAPIGGSTLVTMGELDTVFRFAAPSIDRKRQFQNLFALAYIHVCDAGYFSITAYIQGCQIFHGTIYQNGEKYTNYHKIS
jgi:hypothetical protein